MVFLGPEQLLPTQFRYFWRLSHPPSARRERFSCKLVEMTADAFAVPAPGWERFTLDGPSADRLPDDIVFGAGIPGESELRLIGDLDGRRVLELGCGAGHNAVRMALAGAKVIAVDTSAEQLALAHKAAERAGAKIELHHGELHELAWLRADGIDVALSAYGLATVGDLARVLRQIHRVLRQEAPLILSLPHPALEMVHASASEPLRIRRSWFDQPRSIAEVFTSLTRNNYRVDVMAEPRAEMGRPPASAWADVLQYVPPTMIMRGRKQGL